MPLSPTPDDCYANCENCGDEITYGQYENGDYYYCGDCGEYRCYDCGECSCGEDCDYFNDDDGYSDRRDPRVHSWDYRPNTWRPKGNYPTEALLGLELEVGGRARSIADTVVRFDDNESHLYMKEDGSISGVEIVTHPATLRWSRTFDWDGLLRGLRLAGSQIDDGYGLHIHVSRNAFRRVGYRSTPHQMAWLMFMFRHATELQKLARRESSQWAKFGEPAKGELKRKSENMPSCDDRYVAVNCNNAKTYELRFFCSTLQTNELFAALEFADASVEYTRGIKTSDVLRGQSLTWSHFSDWVNAKDYPNLTGELVRVHTEIESQARNARRRREQRERRLVAARDAAREAGIESLNDDRERAMITAGTRGVVTHVPSGEQFAVGRALDAWWLRAMPSSSWGEFGTWHRATDYAVNGWAADLSQLAPLSYYPVTL